MSTGRNDPCPCGSGRKYKKCCLGRDQADARARARFGLGAPAGESPGAEGVWQVDVSPLSIRIDSEPDARPAVALVVEGGAVLHAELLPAAPAEPGALAAELERVVAQTASRTGAWPARVEVRDAEVARHLGALLAPRDVEVVHRRRLHALDLVAGDLRDHMGRTQAQMPPVSRPDTWRGWGLPAATVADLFRAAAAFWRARPWRQVGSDDPVFALEGTSRPWLCSVLGHGGEEFGLGMYAEAEDFLSAFGPGPGLRDPAGPVLSLTFDRADELSPAMRREVMAAGWEVAGRDAYPVLLAVNTPGGGISRAMAEDLIRLLRAVVEFTAQHAAELDPLERPAEPLDWLAPAAGVRLRLEPGPSFGIPLPPGPLLLSPWPPTSRVGPCLPTGRGADPEAGMEPMERLPGGVREAVEREREVVNRFGRALLRAGLGEATVRKHTRNADVFVQLLVGMVRVPLRAVSEFDLRFVLFDVYPLQVDDAAFRAAAMPVSLGRFFDYLAAREGIVCPWSAAVLAERDEYRERLDTRPPDGDEWGLTDWRSVIAADLFGRAMVAHRTHADGTHWDPQGGPEEAALFHEVQRRWLLWRDEAVLGGTTHPRDVIEAATERQLAWEQAPHPRLGGRTPLEVVQAERRGAG